MKQKEPIEATRASKPAKEGSGNTFFHKVKKAVCLCEPDVVESETDLCNNIKSHPTKSKDTDDKPKTQPNPSKLCKENPEITPMFNPSMTKEFQEVDKKMAKRTAKKAARAKAERKKQEKKEQIRREKEQKKKLKEARKQKKETAKLEKLEQKERRRAKKLAKKGQEKAMSAKGDSKSDRNKQSQLATYGFLEPVDTSPVSPPSASIPHRHQSPLGGSPKIPPGSPHFQCVKSSSVHISLDDGLPVSSDAIPCVEVPLSTADDVVGMSYRSPSQRQSPVTVQRRTSRSPSPARLLSPPNSRVSPPVSRTPHPPSNFSRTEYIPSIGRPTSRRSSKTGGLDNISAEKTRFSSYGSSDINANSRIDPLAKLYGAKTSPAKIPQQTRQQPVRAIHPATETSSKTSKLSRHYSNSRSYSIEDDLIDDVINLQIDDSPGSLSPASTASSSRRSSYIMGQQSKGSTSELRCPPIAGASPQEGASTPKVTRRNLNTEYKPTFAGNASRKVVTTTNGPRVPAISRTKATSVFEESNSYEMEKKEALQRAFSSAQHSVLGTGRTGNVVEGKQREGGMIGLANLGNTCYMNSILQCLAQNKDLKEYFLEGLHLKDINRRSPRHGSLVKSFAEVLKEIWFPKDKNVVAPTHLQAVFQKIARHFGPGKQQDAQEFLCYLLGELHEEINIAAKKQGHDPEIPDDISEDAKSKLAWDRYCAHNNSIFSRLFVGQLKSTLECQTCKNRSVTFDIFWDISLPVPERVKMQRRSSWERDSQPVKTTFDIKDCLNKFTEAEILDGDNMVTCEKCKMKRVFTKSFSIQRFPKHLVLYLKRFNGLRAKLTTYVDFPLKGLEMSEYLADSAAPINQLDLACSIVHLGNANYNLFYRVWKKYLTPPVEDVAYMLSIAAGSASDDGDETGHYDLTGVSQHSGSIIGGHYVAYAKHLLTNKWNCYDDARVDPIAETSVPSSYAYVLFYEQSEQP